MGIYLQQYHLVMVRHGSSLVVIGTGLVIGYGSIIIGKKISYPSVQSVGYRTADPVSAIAMNTVRIFLGRSRKLGGILK